MYRPWIQGKIIVVIVGASIDAESGASKNIFHCDGNFSNLYINIPAKYFFLIKIQTKNEKLLKSLILIINEKRSHLRKIQMQKNLLWVRNNVNKVEKHA